MRSPLSHDERFKNQSDHEKERISGEDWITEFKAKERMVFARAFSFCVIFIVLAIISMIAIIALSALSFRLIPTQTVMTLLISITLLAAVLVFITSIIMKMLD